MSDFSFPLFRFSSEDLHSKIQKGSSTSIQKKEVTSINSEINFQKYDEIFNVQTLPECLRSHSYKSLSGARRKCITLNISNSPICPTKTIPVRSTKKKNFFQRILSFIVPSFIKGFIFDVFNSTKILFGFKRQ